VDVRTVRDKAPIVEHNGTTPVWWLIPPREMLKQTQGGHLELIAVWEITGGGEVFPHQHPTHEFYYVLSGRAVMVVEEEEREISEGDLVYIPPDKVHSVRTISPHAGIRAVSFAVGVPDAGPIDYTKH
jgi:quercetin dioxygenase-like cupin family protein